MEKWRLLGLDVFPWPAEWYPIAEYDTEEEALHAAQSSLRKLERTQPTKRSGGQSQRGLQDQVYIKSPTGELKRIIPNEKQ